MIKRNNISLVLIILMLISCPTNPFQQIPLAASSTHNVQNTTLTTPPLFPKLTLTTTPNLRFLQRCLDVKDKEVVLKEVASGTVLLFPDLLDIQSGKKYKLPAQPAKSGYYGDGYVSPDGKMFAYTEDILNNQSEIISYILWVVDAHAGVLVKIAFNQRDYLGNPRWLDNERLIMDTKEYGTLLVVYPFIREQRVVSNELPRLDLFPFPSGPWWRVEYSPDLEWVVYAYRDDDASTGSIVRDVITKQDLWQSTNGDEGKPAWSPDGQEVAVVGDGQLYLIKHSGQVKPLLNQNLKNQVQSPSWSPDGRYIAFWNFDNLMMYDSQTSEMVDICIKNVWTTKPSVHWSPNSDQFGLDGYPESNITPGDFHILVDIQKSVGYKILDLPNTAYPDVWMKSLP